MRDLKTALALDWDVLARIEQDGMEEEVNIDFHVGVLPLLIFQICIYIVAASVISRNYAVMEYRFANSLYDFSFNGFLRLFW